MTIPILPMPTDLYVYRGKDLHIVDGDTFDVSLDQGMRNYRLERLRVLFVNTPEKKTKTYEAGLAAQKWVEAWLKKANEEAENPEWPLIIQTEKDPDAFGRYLAKVWRTCDQEYLNAMVIKVGHAVKFVR